MIYITLLLFLLFLSLRFDFFDVKSHEKLYFNISFIVLVLIAAIRYRVGSDTLSYMRIYDDIPAINNLAFSDFKLEPLWILLNSLCKFFTPKFYLLQAILAVFVNGVLFKFLKANTPYFFTSVFFYSLLLFNYFNMEILRESVAICIFLLSLKYLFNRNIVKYILLVLLASLFHYGAIILIVFPVLIRIKLNIFSVVFSFIVIFVIFSFGIDFFVKILPLNEVLVKKILYYKLGTLNLNGVTFFIIRELLFPFMVFLLLVNFYRYKHNLNRLSFIYFFIATLTIFFTGFYRFLNYFSIPMIIYISYISVYFIRHKNLFRQVFAVFVASSIILFQIWSVSIDTSEFAPNTRYYVIWSPYKSIFNEEVSKEREMHRINSQEKHENKRRTKKK